jgi:purine-nucleoside phosphorylase
MSIHIAAQPNEIAPVVLITGDPLRARFHAEKLLTQPKEYNHIRGMFGYTGVYLGKKISIQGTGIGIPSTALYLHELIHSYGVKTVIRVGTCGAIQPDLMLGQIIVAENALSDSQVISTLTNHSKTLPSASTRMLQETKKSAGQMDIAIREGTVFSTDLFYHDHDPLRWKEHVQTGVLGVEMETAVVYALATKNKINALSILTVSDHIFSGATASADDREKGTSDMMRLALEVAAQHA